MFPAAAWVKVTATMVSTGVPAAMTSTMRSTSAVVLPVPAEASTTQLRSGWEMGVGLMRRDSVTVAALTGGHRSLVVAARSGGNRSLTAAALIGGNRSLTAAALIGGNRSLTVAALIGGNRSLAVAAPSDGHRS